jgi:hypothetical protein
MSRITKRAHGPAQVANTTATKYTVGTGRRGVVKHLHVYNPSGAPVTFTWSIGADAAGTRILDAFSIAAGAEYNDYGPYTLEASEIIAAMAGTTNVLVLTIDVEETLLT